VANRAKIMPLKVLSKDGRGSVPGIANAIRYAADHGAHVINMSWSELCGPHKDSVPLELQCDDPSQLLKQITLAAQFQLGADPTLQCSPAWLPSAFMNHAAFFTAS